MVANEIGRALRGVPLGALALGVGQGVADAQVALLNHGLDVLSDLEGRRPEERVRLAGVARSLLELGFRPTFHRYAETTADLRFEVQVHRSKRRSERRSEREERSSGAFGADPRALQVDPLTLEHVARYDVSAHATGRMFTRLRAVPAPASLVERARALLRDERIQGEGVAR